MIIKNAEDFTEIDVVDWLCSYIQDYLECSFDDRYLLKKPQVIRVAENLMLRDDLWDYIDSVVYDEINDVYLRAFEVDK